MPNISKINAVDIGNIAKVDGATSSNIAKVDGLDFVTFTGLLDTYTGAAAAYSIRQLKSGVTIAMRVRRDTAGGTGDDDEADVAFDTSLTNPTISLDSAVSNFSATSNATNLGQFLNATGYTDADSLTVVADGFADEWKDQSGNGLDADQATFGSQPQIFDSTSPTDLITENGKPAVEFDGSDDFLSVPGNKTAFKFMHDGSFATLEAVARFGNTSNPDAAYTLFDCGGLASADTGTAINYDDRSSVSRNNQMAALVSAGVAGDANRPVLIQTDNQITPNQQTLVYVQIDADNATANDRCKYAISGGTLTGGNTNTATPTTANNNRDMHLGRYAVSNALQLLGTMQEIVFWNADHSSNRTAIETDIDTYFSIP